MSLLQTVEVWHVVYAQVAVAQEQGAAPQGSPLAGMLPMLIAFFAIMYFLIIRPQQKRERERRELLSALSKGDRVVTTGGICGDIVGLTDSHVVLRVDDHTKIEFVRGAVAQIVSTEGDSA